MFKGKKWMLAAALALLAVPHAYANDGESGFSMVFNLFFGDEAGRNGAASCNQGASGNIGLLGQVNMIFCHLEKDMGITGVGNATKTFTNASGQPGTVKCAVTANAAGATYANTALCWVCSGAGCTNFSRLLNLSWSYASGGANAGELYMDNGAFSGTPGSGEYMKWNIGASAATKSLTAKAVYKTAGGNFNYAVSGQKTGNIRQASMGMYNGSAQFGFETATDVSANLAEAVFMSNSQGSCVSGFDSTTDTQSGLNSCAVCYTRSASGTDYTYTATTSSSCSGDGLSLIALPDTTANIALYTAGDAGVHDILNAGSGEWGGMAATPSF